MEKQTEQERILDTFEKERHIRRKGKIHVVFLVQYLPAWNKSRLVYELLCNDFRFDVSMICLPSQIQSHQLVEGIKSNDTLEYMKLHGYPEAIDAMQGEGKWFELQQLNPEYVFYPRPYNDYLPPEYFSKTVAEYARVCLIPYALALSVESQTFSLNREFFDYVSFYFAETEELASMAKSETEITQIKKWKKCLCCGAPSLTNFIRKKDEPSQVWKFSKNDFRVIWTPRWTNSGELGGSNFLKYYKEFLNYAEKHQEIDFVFRPHPLTFSNFVSTGEMTEQEVEKYKDRCTSLLNAVLDESNDYTATFWQSSVLVSDFSSIMPEYLITGKPIIYCASVMGVTITEDMKKLLEGCYLANTKEEVFHYLEKLQHGEDPLQEKRQTIAKSLFSQHLQDSDVCIMQELLKDKGFWRSVKIQLGEFLKKKFLGNV